MGRRKYPRVGYSKRQGRPHKCRVEGCNNMTNTVVEIQTSWFRGEDDVYWICDSCRNEVKDRQGSDFHEAERIYKAVGTHQG